MSDTEPRYTMQRLGEQLAELSAALSIHIARDAERDARNETMYKIMVTGNGTPSIQERVRNLERIAALAGKVFWVVITPVLVAFGAGIVWIIAQQFSHQGGL